VADALVRGESLVEYFKEMVETAVSRQRVAVEATTSHYVAGCGALRATPR
jgi:hypothetical protein